APSEEEDQPATSQPSEEGSERPEPRYADVYITANSLGAAEQMLWEGLETLTGSDAEPDLQDVIVSMDRMTPEHFGEALQAAKGPKPDMTDAKVGLSRWLE